MEQEAGRSMAKWIAAEKARSGLRSLRHAEKVRGVHRIGGGRWLREGAERKKVDGVFPGRPLSFRYQRRLVDDCNPGRGGMAQDGRTSGGTFDGEMDCCQESQGWTTAIPERDVKDQGGKDSPKQAGSSCWFARHS